MGSPFERAARQLEHYWDGSGLDHLLERLHGIHDLLSLRATSRTFKYSRRIRTKAFSTLYIHTPPHGEQSIDALPLVGPSCQHLNINVAYTRLHNPDAWHARNRHGVCSSRAKRVLQHLQCIEEDHEHERQHPPFTHCTNLQHTSSTVPTDAHPANELVTSSEPRPTAYKYLLQRRPTDLNYTLLQRWHQILSLVPYITTLTIAVNGESHWPGCTDIEMLLIVLRIAIERVNFKYLLVVRFAPIHAGGLMYLRWNGLGAFGEAAGRVWHEQAGRGEIGREMRERGCVWQRIQRLELWVRNPYVDGRFSEGQKNVFEAVLKDYLRAFRKSLMVLVFGWGDGEGPIPLLLKSEKDDEAEAEWMMLEQVWLGSCAFKGEDLADIRRSARKLKKLMFLVPRVAQSGGIGGGQNGSVGDLVWRDALYTGRISPVESQHSTVSDTSRCVPIRLDIQFTTFLLAESISLYRETNTVLFYIFTTNKPHGYNSE